MNLQRLEDGLHHLLWIIDNSLTRVFVFFRTAAPTLLTPTRNAWPVLLLESTSSIYCTYTKKRITNSSSSAHTSRIGSSRAPPAGASSILSASSSPLQCLCGCPCQYLFIPTASSTPPLRRAPSSSLEPAAFYSSSPLTMRAGWEMALLAGLSGWRPSSAFLLGWASPLPLWPAPPLGWSPFATCPPCRSISQFPTR
jgi:hypothetical protein